MKKFYFIIFIVVFIISYSFAESNNIDKKGLFKTYGKMSRGGYAMEKALLTRIENEFDKMEYSADDKELIKTLIYLSEEGVLRKEFEHGQVINNHMDIRTRAVRLLAKIGGDDACQALCKLLCHENDINVITAIFDSFIDIRDNDEGIIMQAILNAYRLQGSPNHTFLISLIRVLKYVIGENDHSYQEAISLLKDIMTREDVKEIVKNEARIEIVTLQRYREATIF